MMDRFNESELYGPWQKNLGRLIVFYLQAAQLAPNEWVLNSDYLGLVSAESSLPGVGSQSDSQPAVPFSNFGPVFGKGDNHCFVPVL